MSLQNLIIQSLKTYSKQHLSVFLAVLVSAAVLTGALIVGDSVRLSLEKNVAMRLGSAEWALSTGDRFLSLETAHKLKDKSPQKMAAILQAQGMAINAEKDLRHNRIQILGVEEDFWQFTNKSFQINYGEAVVSRSLADELKIENGDRLLIRIKKTSLIPLNAPFTADEDPSIALRLKIVGIAERDNLGGFSLRNEQATAYNLFINQQQLADRLDLDGYCNLILSEKADERLHQETLKSVWSLKDAAIKVSDLEDSSGIRITSERVFIDDAVIAASEHLSLHSKKSLTYFVNELRCGDKSTPYSFVSGIEDSQIKKDHLIINSWLANDLLIKTGDTIQLKYFFMGPLRKLIEKEKALIVQEILPIEPPLFSAHLMPDFPGLSTAGNCSDWDAGIPIDLDKIRDKDEAYWDDYRGTPKAIIPLDLAVELWQNTYGTYSSVLFSEEVSKEELADSILSQLNPKDFGFQFIDVKQAGQAAANNGVDFGGLFLSLSFFVIAAAILLLVLILKLQLQSRTSETGVLLSLGFSHQKIIKIRFLENFPGILLGSALGAFLGIFYNLLLIKGLNSIWNQAVHTSILEAFVLSKTISIGFLSSLVLSAFVIWVTLRNQLKKSSIGLIRNQEKKLKKIKIWGIFGFVLTTIAIILGIYSISNSIAKNSSLVLGAGFLFLSGISAMLYWRWSQKETSKNLSNIYHLASRNIKRNINRSMAVVILLALGTFTIIVTGSNRKSFQESENKRQSGTGGFLFWGETSIPVLFDLNSEEARNKLGLSDEEILDSCSFVPLFSKVGDNASCLNLNQVQQAQILGLDSKTMDSLQAFSFAKLLEERAHPWLSLNESLGENIIPAIADQTVIQWGLIKKLGDTLHYFNEEGQALKVVLVGGLKGSIFQGNILISAEQFRKHFPSASGASFMLIDGPAEKKQAIKQIFTNDLSDYGMELTETTTRLAQFYSVTNTYLSIFMILGGLGVIIGTIGLGMILLRNMTERKSELALLNSLGFSQIKIFRIIFTENLILVFWGLGIGIISALIGILPSLLSAAFTIPGAFLIWIILTIFASAVFWIYVSAKVVLRRV
jgi:ABC-type lipoprotein release transport system permease subunit